MISFEQCPYCTQVARVQFGNSNSEEKKKKQDEMICQLEDLMIQVTVNDRYYRCRQCGTYYRFESDFSGTVGYYNYRLVRITIIEALLVFQSDFKTVGDFDKTYQQAEDSGLCRIELIRKLLESSIATAKEFAAETLADVYKKQNKPDKVQDILLNPDANVRLGALWSYAEIPWRSYNADEPRLNNWNGIFNYKPFGKLSSVLKTVIALLCDSDKRIRIIARSFSRCYFMGKGKELLPKLRRIPNEKWSAELKSLLINENYPYTDNTSFTELCNFLIDPEEEVRSQALSRIYDMYSEKDIPTYINYIKILSEKNPTTQIKWFLAHPYAGLEKDDDNYFD